MPAHKKQHYVPRFYLKRFSNDSRSITIFNIPNERLIKSANLKNQCYKDYFYGDDGVLENHLCKIENFTAKLLREIDVNIGLPESQLIDLIMFILIQYGRTDDFVKEINEMTGNFMKHLLAGSLNDENIDFDDVNIGLEDPNKWGVGYAMTTYPLLFDLEIKLLINDTSTEFITSDAPVVLYNQLFESLNFGSNTGFGVKGLQMFYPISPKLCIMLYDPVVYTVGKKNSKNINVKQKDVYQLNTLQMCSADKNVYFNNSSLNTNALYKNAIKYRKEVRSEFGVLNRTETETRRTELTVSSKIDIKTKLKLSFCRITNKTKTWKEELLRKSSIPAVIMRNDQIVDDHKEFISLIREGKYKGTEFFKFMDDKYETIS